MIMMAQPVWLRCAYADEVPTNLGRGGLCTTRTEDHLISPPTVSHAAWDAHAVHGVHARYSVSNLGTAPTP